MDLDGHEIQRWRWCGDVRVRDSGEMGMRSDAAVPVIESVGVCESDREGRTGTESTG
jgi:hypothetical protein